MGIFIPKSTFMRKILFVLSASLFVFGKCNKTDESPVTVADFVPLTVGSSWTYLSTTTTTTTTTANFTLAAINKDTAINGRTYKVLSNSAGANNYWCRSGDDYYRYGAFPGASFIGNVEELYLKDNLATNGTWTNSFPITYNSVPLTVTGNYKISATGATKTVGTQTFTNVTQVHADFTTALPPFLPTTTVASGDFYYAKGIGLVNMSVTVNANATLMITGSTVKWDIQSYVIK